MADDNDNKDNRRPAVDYAKAYSPTSPVYNPSANGQSTTPTNTNSTSNPSGSNSSVYRPPQPTVSATSRIDMSTLTYRPATLGASPQTGDNSQGAWYNKFIQSTSSGDSFARRASEYGQGYGNFPSQPYGGVIKPPSYTPVLTGSVLDQRPPSSPQVTPGIPALNQIPGAGRQAPPTPTPGVIGNATTYAKNDLIYGY